MDGQVEFITEIDKERGNKNDHVGIDKEEFDANQLNDGFNVSIKLTRHEYTIDNVNFSYIISDLQRPNSVNADFRETAEDRVEINERTELATVLKGFSLTYSICSWIINRYESFKLEFRTKRKDAPLYLYLYLLLAQPFYNILTRHQSLYTYSVIKYKRRKNVTADTSGVSVNEAYYVISQKMFADRYATDCFSRYFENDRERATRGFYDAPQYRTFRASQEELNNQNSYLINQIKKGTRK